MSEDFYVKRNNKNMDTIDRLLEELPAFCNDYFLGIDSKTSTLTRLNYAHDLKIFFFFLQEKKYRGKKLIKEISLDDLEQITSNDIESKEAGRSFPELVESASIDDDGLIYSTITNTSASKTKKIKCQIADTKVKNIRAEIISGDIHDKNDFDNNNNVTIREFTDFRKLSDGFTAAIPPCSVVKFVVEK